MAFSPDVELTVETLMEMGVLTEEGCEKFANMVRSLRVLSAGGFVEQPKPSVRRGRKPGQKAAPKQGGTGKKRGKRLGIEREELEDLIEKGMTNKEIANLKGVSAITVSNWRKKLDLQSTRGGGRPRRVDKEAEEGEADETEETEVEETEGEEAGERIDPANIKAVGGRGKKTKKTKKDED